ncbi:capsular exopolysaccharide family [Geodermatophilus telluris]|uniref:Capsular exopolysaccharide family n=2 Tax=Geodermatophilus telluris TaxID=1190417 RepID=A0A1G6L6R7_9ACTN|nr:capsular exopolysaccharide family [Geodermatophilus telluris]
MLADDCDRGTSSVLLEGDKNRMPYAEYIRALRAGWWLAVLGALLGAGLATAVVMASTPLYETNTRLFVSTVGTDDLATAVQGSQFSQERVASYAQLLESRDLMATVIDRLDLATTPDELQSQIEATVVPETVLLDVTVTDPEPERALAITSSVADEFGELVTRLETPEDATTSPVRIAVVASPELPTEPSSPRTARDVPLGAALGLLAGMGAAVLRGRRDTAVKDDDATATAVGAPVIGDIVTDAQLAEAHVMRPYDTSRVAEGFRQVRANLQFLRVDQPPRVILVSSPLAGEGKSTLTVNLALALSETGLSVTLVEADLRRPRAARYLGRVTGVGLTNILSGTADLDDVLQPHGDGRLQVLASGPKAPNPGELLSSEAMSQVLAQLRTRSDVVLVDGPPLLPVADAVGLASRVDGVVICARFGKTPREALESSREVLDRVGASVLGAVLTMVPPRARTTGAYAYGYSDDPPDRPRSAHRSGSRAGRRAAAADGSAPETAVAASGVDGPPSADDGRTATAGTGDGRPVASAERPQSTSRAAEDEETADRP